MPTPTHRSRGRDAVDLADGWLQVVSTRHHPPAEDVRRDPARGLDLVLFDMDGTLIGGLSSWEIIHQHFGVSNAANWQRYARGEITDDEFIRSDLELWHYKRERIHVDEIDEVLTKEIHLMPHARECIAELRSRGIATCILSGGIDILARRVAEVLGIDMYVANGLHLDPEGYLRGHGITYVKLNDKATPTREILKRFGVQPHRAAGVGNSMYDVGIFRETGFGVAVNPFDDEVRAGADRVVEGTDMREVLRHLLDYAGAGSEADAGPGA